MPDPAAGLLQCQNLLFRIPTPTYGLGLIEVITGGMLRANLAANATGRISAWESAERFNINGNDGTITRFGWKAQNKSLLVFSGEAYNVEIGVTNELFPQEREEIGLPSLSHARGPRRT